MKIRILFVSYFLNSRALSLPLFNKPWELGILVAGFLTAGENWVFFYRDVPPRLRPQAKSQYFLFIRPFSRSILSKEPPSAVRAAGPCWCWRAALSDVQDASRALSCSLVLRLGSRTGARNECQVRVPAVCPLSLDLIHYLSFQ